MYKNIEKAGVYDGWINGYSLKQFDNGTALSILFNNRDKESAFLRVFKDDFDDVLKVIGGELEEGFKKLNESLACSLEIVDYKGKLYLKSKSIEPRVKNSKPPTFIKSGWINGYSVKDNGIISLLFKPKNEDDGVWITLFNDSPFINELKIDASPTDYRKIESIHCEVGLSKSVNGKYTNHYMNSLKIIKPIKSDELPF